MDGLAILLGFNLLGLVLQHLGVPLPGNVIGLVLFVAALFAGVVKVKWVEPAADVLLRNMLLFFAPLIVGAMAFVPLLRAQWLTVTLAVLGGTIAVMLTTGFVARFLIRPDHADVTGAKNVAARTATATATMTPSTDVDV